MKDGTIEILTFSKRQLFGVADGIEKWNEGSIVTRSLYNGEEFTDRRSVEVEPVSWEDAEVIFEGVVDEEKITYQDVDQYELFCELREELK
ncbi:hypothetical protein K8R66_01895 [bacterium]|nr:hypothetical protein [bacterium]